jgi:hypothetical protein
MLSTLDRAAAALVVAFTLTGPRRRRRRRPTPSPPRSRSRPFGEIAPPLGAVPWIQLDEASDPARGGKEPDIAAMRGTVTIVDDLRLLLRFVRARRRADGELAAHGESCGACV